MNPAFGHLPLKFVFFVCVVFFFVLCVLCVFLARSVSFFCSVLLFDLLVAVCFDWNHNGAEPLYLTWVKKIVGRHCLNSKNMLADQV